MCCWLPSILSVSNWLHLLSSHVYIPIKDSKCNKKKKQIFLRVIQKVTGLLSTKTVG